MDMIHGSRLLQTIVMQTTLYLWEDYFDAFVITPAVQIHNFKEIIEFKEANPDKVTLLIGNHDYHYTPHCTGRYGGWSAWHAVEIGELLKENKDHLQVAWQQDNVLATHAGRK